MIQDVLIIDYGLGNLFNVGRAFDFVGAQSRISRSPDEILSARRLVLPGVGAFGDGMDHIDSLNLKGPILEAAARGTPILGLCVGMQLLFEGSDEFGKQIGLGIIPGWVRRIPETGLTGQKLKVPHIGWSSLVRHQHDTQGAHPILEGIDEGAAVYFVHSYMACPVSETDTLASVDYDGHLLSAVVASRNVIGCQFHPERSGPVGLEILKNFLNFSPDSPGTSFKSL